MMATIAAVCLVIERAHARTHTHSQTHTMLRYMVQCGAYWSGDMIGFNKDYKTDNIQS